jgi:hypothetical protein
MIGEENIQFLKNLHFDKQEILNDKIQFSFLILKHSLHLAVKLEGQPWITSGKNWQKYV